MLPLTVAEFFAIENLNYTDSLLCLSNVLYHNQPNLHISTHIDSRDNNMKLRQLPELQHTVKQSSSQSKIFERANVLSTSCASAMTTNVEDDVDCSRDSVEMLIAKMTESKNKTKTTKMFQPKLKQKRNDEVTKQQCKSRKSHQATQWTTASCNNSGRSKHCNPRTNEPRQLEVDRHCYISLLHMTTDGCLLSAVSCLLFAFAAAAAVPSRDNCTLLTMNRN